MGRISSVACGFPSKPATLTLGSVVAGLGVLACGRAGGSAGGSGGGPESPLPPNIVLIVLDDMGVDKVAAYGEGPAGVPPPCTPNLDALAASGVLFRNAWASAICSPTRAQLLTGRHSFRTGIGSGIGPDGTNRGLRVDLEPMLPRKLLGYDTSAVGKWHLMSPMDGSADHPVAAGFARYSGSLFNLIETMASDPVCGAAETLGYTNWVEYEVDGPGTPRPTCRNVYATTDEADDAIARAWAMREPWFLYVAFHAAHAPFEPPPPALCPAPGTCATQHCPGDGSDPALDQNATIEALDAELGRMLAVIRMVDPEPFVFVIGDNGTPGDLSRGQPGSCFDPERGKGRLYESGVNVPLIASGPLVVPGECTALVCATDLYSTIEELAGVAADGEDSISLVPYLHGDMRPRRATVYTELFLPNQPSSLEHLPFAPRLHVRAIRDERYKLLRYTSALSRVEELYDLQSDPCEQLDLCTGTGECVAASLAPEALEHYLALRAELVALGVD